MANIDIFRDTNRNSRPLITNPFFTSPFSTGGNLLSDIEPIFREFDRMMQPLRSRMTEDFLPMSCDIRETESEYLLSYDIPGMKQDDINIEIQGNRLVISGERQTQKKSEEERSMERQYRSVYQSFLLPENVDSENIEANYEDGVLYLGIPKTEASTRKKISIGSSKEGGILSKLLGKKSEKQNIKTSEAS